MAVIGPLEMKMLLDLEGAAEAEGGIKRVRQEIDKTTDATDDNTLAGVRNEQQQTNTFLALQALTSGLNQLSGGFNKVSGSMIAMGWEEQGMALQKTVRQFELLTGSLEVGIAVMNIYTGTMQLYTTSAFAATYATLGFNAALAANPLVMIGMVIAGVILTLIALGARFRHVTDTVEGLTIALKELMEWLGAVQDKIGGVGDAVGDFAEGVTDQLSIGGRLGGGAVG